MHTCHSGMPVWDCLIFWFTSWSSFSFHVSYIGLFLLFSCSWRFRSCMHSAALPAFCCCCGCLLGYFYHFGEEISTTVQGGSAWEPATAWRLHLPFSGLEACTWATMGGGFSAGEPGTAPADGTCILYFYSWATGRRAARSGFWIIATPLPPPTYFLLPLLPVTALLHASLPSLSLAVNITLLRRAARAHRSTWREPRVQNAQNAERDR